MEKPYVIQTWVDSRSEWVTLSRSIRSWEGDSYDTLEGAKYRLKFVQEHADKDLKFRIATRECVYKEVI